MSDGLAIVVDGQLVVHYDRNAPLPAHQRQALDTMDAKMNSGITLGEREVPNPDPLQRAQFVASNLVQALIADNESLIAASTTYLAVRMPQLKQVRATVKGPAVSYELVFDKEYVTEHQVQFFKNKPSTH